MIDRREVLLVAAAAGVAGPAERAVAADQRRVAPPTLRGNAVTLGAGRHVVTRDTHFPDGLCLEPGAVLAIEDCTVLIDGFFVAPRQKVFDCRMGGKVQFGEGAVIEAFPEWWGALTGDADTDCLPALTACFEAAEVTRLAAADYHIRDTLKLHTPYHHLQGTGWFGTEPRSASRLVLTGSKAGTASVLQIGPDRAPESVDHFDFSIGVADLVVTRTAACVPPPAGEETQAACGVVIRHVVQCRLDRITAIESSIGFYIHDVVFTKLTDCFTQRYKPGTHSDKDVMRGFYLDGRRKGIFSGGNASLYLERCNVTGSHPSHFDAIAFKASGAFCDIYLDKLETSNVPKGCVLEADNSPNPDNGNINCHVRDAIFDWCILGIEIRSAPPAMTAVFSDIYVSLAHGALTGMAIHDGGGQVTITGGEIHAGATLASLWIARQSGVSVQGLRIRNSKHPVVLEAARGCDLQFSVNNVLEKADRAAVTMTDCARNYLRPVLLGGSGSFPLGVELAGTANHHNEVNCTGIDPAIVAGVAAVLRHNGTPVTARGEFGEGNLASGAMA